MGQVPYVQGLQEAWNLDYQAQVIQKLPSEEVRLHITDPVNPKMFDREDLTRCVNRL